MPRKKLTNSSLQRPLNYASYHQPMVYRQPVGRQARRQRSNFKSKLYVSLVVLSVVGIFGHVMIAKHASAESAAAQAKEQAALEQAREKSSVFSNQVNQLLSNNPGDTISVATASDRLGLQTFGSSQSFDGASTEKLLTAVDYLRHVENGTASLIQKIDGQPAGSLIKAMIINSDDSAWASLDAYLTHPDMLAYAKSIGYDNYDPDTNNFPASDVALLLQKLYSGSLLNSSHRSLLLNYMSQANYRQYIVGAVPASDSVYHKIGFDGDTLNDGAIITNGQKYLVLVIFTNGNGSYDLSNRQQVIQSITKDAIAAYL